MSHVQTTSDRGFEQDVLKATKLVLVDFWAEWCGPCKMLAPVLEEVAEHFQDKVSIFKLNVDHNSEIPAKFGIRGIPTLILFKNGASVVTKVGGMSKAQLIEFLNGHLK